MPETCPSHRFRSRLQQLIGPQSVHAFARRCGLSESLVRKYLQGSQPGLDKLVLIARCCGVSLEWLAGLDEGVADARPDYAARPVTPAWLTDEARPPPLAFAPDWLEETLARPADRLRLWRVVDDAMAPLARRMDLLLVDTADRPRGEDGVFVIEDHGHRLRRLQWLPDGVLRLVCDAPGFPPVTRPADAVAVVGRPCWQGRPWRDPC